MQHFCNTFKDEFLTLHIHKRFNLGHTDPIQITPKGAMRQQGNINSNTMKSQAVMLRKIQG